MQVRELQEGEINFNLSRTLELATDVQSSYRASDASRRRLLNHCFFKKLTIHDDGHIESEFAEPYDVLLNPTLRARAKTAIRFGELVVPEAQPAQSDWKARETSFDDNTRKVFLRAGVGKPRGPRGRQGLNNEILVVLSGGLSNHSLVDLVHCLTGSSSDQGPDQSRMERAGWPDGRRTFGTVSGAIVVVLADVGTEMRLTDIHVQVERVLGGRVSSDCAEASREQSSRSAGPSLEGVLWRTSRFLSSSNGAYFSPQRPIVAAASSDKQRLRAP